MSAEEADDIGENGATDETDGGTTVRTAGPPDTVERVRDALREVIDPCSAATGSNLDVIEMGLVTAIEVDPRGGDGAHVHVDLRLTSPMCHQVPYFFEEIEGRVGDLAGVETAELETDHGLTWTEDMMSPAAKRERQAALDDREARYRREMGLEIE